MQPLENIKVIDFTTLLPGPLASLMLAEAGAEVIKVERPGGDELRHYPPDAGGMSALFAVLNRGKKSVVADLKDDADRADVTDLIRDADILIEQFRPGVMDRLGFGYEAVRAVNPGIIYCSISGYGADGPRAAEAGHDLNYQALSGLLALSCGSAGHPVLPPTQIADIGGGSLPAVMNILLALLRRERSGEGARLDIAMTDAMFTFAAFAMAEGLASGRFADNGIGLLTGGLARYNLYPAADGRLIAVAALEPKFWTAFCDVIDLPADLRDDVTEPAAVKSAVAERLARKTAAEWEPLFAAADCCVTLVKTLAEARADPHFRGRGLFDRAVGLPKGARFEAAVVPVAPDFRISSNEVPSAPELEGRNHPAPPKP